MSGKAAPQPAWPTLARRGAAAIGCWYSCRSCSARFVAGLKAGASYNTWPLMDGRLIPTASARWSPGI